MCVCDCVFFLAETQGREGFRLISSFLGPWILLVGGEAVPISLLPVNVVMGKDKATPCFWHLWGHSGQ